MPAYLKRHFLQLQKCQTIYRSTAVDLQYCRANQPGIIYIIFLLLKPYKSLSPIVAEHPLPRLLQSGPCCNVREQSGESGKKYRFRGSNRVYREAGSGAAASSSRPNGQGLLSPLSREWRPPKNRYRPRATGRDYYCIILSLKGIKTGCPKITFQATPPLLYEK